LSFFLFAVGPTSPLENIAQPALASKAILPSVQGSDARDHRFAIVSPQAREPMLTSLRIFSG
jgi:hypothetical protein